MAFVVFGLNHNTAPIEVRERLFVPEDSIPGLLRELKEKGVGDNVVLSTCNRTEIYFSCGNLDSILEKFYTILSAYFGLPQDWLKKYTYLLTEEDGYRHLFLVASGLDSMVVGEPQILGQVKDAYRLATDHNATGILIDKVFHRTFHVAKRVRRETRIGYNPVSISAMAIELAKKIFGELKGRKALVIGAGEMCEIAVKYFRKEGVSDIFISNRTFQNAQKLADEVGGIPYPFDDLHELLTRTDMVLSSTGSPTPLITRELVSVAMKKRKQRPLFFIDIAVPRDVDFSVNDIDNVYLYDIDDLKELSQRHLSDRLTESEKARLIVEEEVNKFNRWLEQRDRNPLIASIYEKVERIRVKEVRKILQKLPGADDDMVRNLEVVTKSIVNKIVHPHVSIIKENGSPAVIDLMKKAFQLENEGDDEEELDNRNEGQ